MFRFNRKKPGYIVFLVVGTYLVYQALEGDWSSPARAGAALVGGLLLGLGLVG